VVLSGCIPGSRELNVLSDWLTKMEVSLVGHSNNNTHHHNNNNDTTNDNNKVSVASTFRLFLLMSVGGGGGGEDGGGDVVEALDVMEAGRWRWVLL